MRKLLFTLVLGFSFLLSGAQILDIGDTLKLSTITNGLVGYYPFTGNAGDSSGTGNHGAVVNGAALTTDRFGNPNSAYLFDGVNDYISIADHNSLDFTDSFSITLWLNQYSTSAGGYRLFDKTTVGINDGYNFDTYGASGRKVRLTGGLTNVEANASFNLNTWNQVLVIHYKDTTWLYQNSAMIGKGVQKNILSNSLTARIASNQNGGNYFNGKIDEVRVYNRALCDLEIKMVYGTTLTLSAKASKPFMCGNTSTAINIANPQPYIQYRLLKASDSSQVGVMQSSKCSDTLRFSTGNLNQTTSYRIKATDPANSQFIYLDTIITVTITPAYNDTIDTLLCNNGSVFFNGQPRSIAGFYVANLKNIAGCDSIVTLHLMKSTPASYSRSIAICGGDSILLQNAYRKAGGVYYDTITRPGLCDSIVASTLTVNPVKTTNQNKTICSTDSVLLQGTYRKTAGTYYDTLNTSLNCDSIIITQLTIRNTSSGTASLQVCNGDSILFGGKYIKTTGTYYDTLPAANTCDSVVTANITFLNSLTIYQFKNICINDSVLVNGHYLKNEGFYYDTLQSASGCDSIITTEITHIQPDTATKQIKICATDSFKIGNKYYKTAGTYTDTVYTGNCLDSIVKVQLTVRAAQFTSTNIQLCIGDSITLGTKKIKTAGVYYDSLKNSNGCDSVAAYNVSVYPKAQHINNLKFCLSDSVLYKGTYYSIDTVFYDTLSTAFGCDSIVTTNLIEGGYPLQLADTAFYCETNLATLDAGKYVSYLWSTGSASRYLTTNIDGIYWVTVADSFNCSFTDSALVFERCNAKIFIPTSFSPNDDGINDYLVFSAYNVDYITFRIFNRWGETVFETTDKDIRWDGKYNNLALPIGTYFWTCNYAGKNYEGNLERKNETGVFHIIR